MRFLFDSCVGRTAAERLREAGHDVVRIQELGDDPGDARVLQIAWEQDRILVTADKDFGELVFRLRQIHSGVVLIRLHGIPPFEKATIVTAALEKHLSELYYSFTVIQKNAVRIKQKQ